MIVSIMPTLVFINQMINTSQVCAPHTLSLFKKVYIQQLSTVVGFFYFFIGLLFGAVSLNAFVLYPTFMCGYCTRQVGGLNFTYSELHAPLHRDRHARLPTEHRPSISVFSSSILLLQPGQVVVVGYLYTFYRSFAWIDQHNCALQIITSMQNSFGPTTFYYV